MAELYWDNIEIAGVAGAVPERVVDNLNYSDFFTEKEAKSVIKLTGIPYRRLADEGTCASDFCYAAAERLIKTMKIDRSEIDALIYTTQSPDYRMPATGVILQHRLGLPKTTLSFDLPLGCSGFVYGLSMAFNLCRQPHINQVLILDGESTKWKKLKNNKGGLIITSSALLWGHGGTAALIRKTDRRNPTYLSLLSDGSRWQSLHTPAGGYRNPTSLETLKMKKREDGSIKSDEHGTMDGAAVFEFTITDVPRDIKNTVKLAQTTFDDIDYFVFHQANKFMTDHFCKKLKIPLDRVPYSLHKFGNTASFSIPLTIVSELKCRLNSTIKLLMSGFGIGLSWGTVVTEVDNCTICELLEI
jgi:3-oxoacyl-[acyl-carrier-protein] synthase-3